MHGAADVGEGALRARRAVADFAPRPDRHRRVRIGQIDARRIDQLLGMDQVATQPDGKTLAGAAISVTVNELVGPLFGNFLFMIFAIVILVFGHGLNMILNVLSVIVHGIRLNTLEFSSHLDITWSGHKFKPFIN